VPEQGLAYAGTFVADKVLELGLGVTTCLLCCKAVFDWVVVIVTVATIVETIVREFVVIVVSSLSVTGYIVAVSETSKVVMVFVVVDGKIV
jgi:hypothetical protein